MNLLLEENTRAMIGGGAQGICEPSLFVRSPFARRTHFTR
jgi:hypothetical protein